MEIFLGVALIIAGALSLWAKEALSKETRKVEKLQSQLEQCQAICDQYKEKAVLLEQELNKHYIRHAAKEWARSTDPFVRPLNHCNCVPPANLPE